MILTREEGREIVYHLPLVMMAKPESWTLAHYASVASLFCNRCEKFTHVWILADSTETGTHGKGERNLLQSG
jgi:hypothetical protein